MRELTAESTFSECAEFYLNNKLLTSASGIHAIKQKEKCYINIYPSIGDIPIKSLNYSDCIALLTKVKNKNYSQSYICACWCTIKQVINMTVELNIIKKPEFCAISVGDMLNEIGDTDYSNISGNNIKEVFKHAGVLDDYIIARHTSVFSYLVYLYNKNDVRNHHVLPVFVMKCIYKSIGTDVINKPIKEVNQYDIKKINHDIRLHGYSSEYIKQIMQLFRFAFTNAYENGLIDSLLQ